MTGSGAFPSGKAYAELLEHFRQSALLRSTAALLAWDQEVLMPAAAVTYRSRQVAQLAAMIHHRLVDPTVGERLAICRHDHAITADPDGDEAVNLRQWQRAHDRAVRLPVSLVEQLAKSSTVAKAHWAEAKRHDDFGRFAPHLAELLALSRDKAACLGTPDGGEPWDALADGFEPGMTAARLTTIFEPLALRLQTLVDRYDGCLDDGPARFGAIDTAAMARFVRAVAARLGFDFQRGRLDTSAHPFCSTFNGDDVRMTTRFVSSHPLEPLFSTMHEAGHGIYNQGLPAEHWGTPRGSSVSYAIHESQSRLWENLVGRSPAFWQWLVPEAGRMGVGALMARPVSEMVAAANAVRRSLIRVEADETTYNLHIIVRFELERALIGGDLEADDLPAAWAQQYRDRLGVAPTDAATGCLQDIHWSQAAFGYFPSYALGNLYAAQFYLAAQTQMPDLESDIAAGRFELLRTWLNEKVHMPGMTWDAETLCRRVTGRPLSAEPFVTCLAAKLEQIYGTR